MKKSAVLLSLLFCSFYAFSQSWELGIVAGASNYRGDLAQRTFQQAKPAFGLTAGYEISERFTLRGGLTFAKIAGADKKGKDDFLKTTRNLSFQSNLTEFSLVGEYDIFNLNEVKWTPYLFGGLGVYHYNPYTFDSLNKKVYLKPLSTEGEGLTAYPGRKFYSLTQLSIPFGGGIKYAINDNIRVGLEIGLRKLFTDYLDDVSTTYVDSASLLAERGQQAVDLSYRGNSTYPEKNAQRGNPKNKDWYHFTVLTLTFRWGNGAIGGGRSGRRGYGCPANPM